MKATSRTRALKAAALHWLTFYSYVHGTLPRQRDDEASRTALRDIVLVQCFGEEGRALSMIEDIVRARIKGDSLAERYVSYWWHIETGRPKCWQLVPQSIARDIRRCIRRNVRAA